MTLFFKHKKYRYTFRTIYILCLKYNIVLGILLYNKLNKIGVTLFCKNFQKITPFVNFFF